MHGTGALPAANHGAGSLPEAFRRKHGAGPLPDGLFDANTTPDPYPTAYSTQALRGSLPAATGDLPGAAALPASTAASAVNASGLDE